MICTESNCDRKVHANRLCARHNQQRYSAAGRRKKYSYTCTVCQKPGESVDKKTTKHAYCHRYNTQLKGRRLSTCQDLVLYKAPTPSQKKARTPKQYLWIMGYCVICSKEFIDWNPRKTCSTECSKQMKKKQKKLQIKRRRLRQRNNFIHDVDPLVVYERDNYTCQLCLKHVEMHTKAPSKFAPTLDHTIPLALGGAHSYQNIKLAHFICNSTKSDTCDRTHV